MVSVTPMIGCVVWLPRPRIMPSWQRQGRGALVFLYLFDFLRYRTVYQKGNCWLESKISVADPRVADGKKS